MQKSKYSLVLDIQGKHILFNTIYGTADLIDSTILDKWNSTESIWSPDEIGQLSARGHLIDPCDEKKMEIVVSSRDADYKDHKSKFYLIYSYMCNFNCFYCFENTVKQASLMSMDQLQKAFDAILKIIAINRTTDNEIVLFGGEPLLDCNRTLIEETFMFATRHNIKIAVITNGSNILNFSDLFFKYKNHISCCSITIDGVKKEHDARRTYKNSNGSYEDILTSINFLFSQDIPVTIRMNLDKSIKSSITHAIKELYNRLGAVPNIYISLVDDATCTEECANLYTYLESAKLLNDNGYFDGKLSNRIDLNIKPIKQIHALLSGKQPKPRFRHCRMSELYLFSPNGCIYVCPQSCHNSDFCIGHFWPSVIIDSSAISEQHALSALKMDNCTNCALSPICGGGCYVKQSFHQKAFGHPICYKEDLIDTLKFMIQQKFMCTEQ